MCDPLSNFNNSFSNFKEAIYYLPYCFFQGMGFGSQAKIFLSFDKQWWKHEDPGFYFYWRDEDRAQMEKEVRIFI